MANESLNSARARVARLEANAARKIQRNKREKGVEIVGTQFDPRTTKDVSKMRSRDVAAYERRLSKFLSRSTQFEAGHRGSPLPRTKWNEYKQTEDAVRGKFNAELEPVKNVKLPGPGDETIGIRQDKMRTKHPTALNMGYVPPERKPFNVKDLASLDKLTKANKKRMTQKWAAKERKRAKDELRQMVEVFNDPGINKAVEGMSKGQFNVLWNMTRFADFMSLTYHHYQKKYTPKQQMPQEVIDSQLSQARQLIEWVKKMKI